ncbi:MAG TPA: putative porin [Bacteroidia bacterium]|nr:putative porin [Bacteroidia bacterium]
MKQNCLFFLLLILCAFSGIAQKTDSVGCRDCKGSGAVYLDAERIPYRIKDSTEILTSTSSQELFNEKYSQKNKDSILDNLHNYYQTGVLGNIGMPSYSLLAHDNTQNGFFNWMNLNNNNDLFSNKQSVYFYPQGKIYTRVFAAMGQKQEQVFKILHSQNIKRVNISLQFNRYSCFGFYVFQKTITDNLLFSSHAETKNGRLGYNFYYMYNKLKYQLNGGIDSSKANFEKNILAEKQLFPMNLSTAKQNLRTSEVNFSAFFKINADSSCTSHKLVYESNYQSNYWLYTEGAADSSHYAHNYFYAANGSITDSVSFKRFSNSLLYKINYSGKFTFFAGYKNEFNHYSQFATDTMNMNHILSSGFNVAGNKFSVSAKGQYVVSGFNANNWQFEGNFFTKVSNQFYFSGNVQANSKMPSYMSTVYYSPHNIWSNTFMNVLTDNAEVKFGSRKYRFSIGVFVQQQQHQVYFDTLALPEQYKGSTLISRFYIQKDLKLGPVHFNNTINYQTTQNTDIIRLPQLNTSHQLYLEAKLFKNNLWLQAGFQARYISSFMANAYSPATNQFYLQNKKEYGNYVFVDFFVNAQIERFRFFLLASHLNQGLSGGNYMLCPNYGMPDRSFKAGLTWMFFD